jgi:hypothetical protein
MRFNTKLKRRAVKKEMVKELTRQGYMYNNAAEEVVNKWIAGGIRSITSEIVRESVRLAILNYTYHRGKFG